MARALRHLAIAFLALFALAASAAGDWIDELPTVTAVANAVAEQLKVDTADWRFDMRGIALKDDDDLFAVRMVGTLVMLRQIILYKYQKDKALWTDEELATEEESLTEEELSPEGRAARKARQEKLKSVVAAYLEAELHIGKGVGKRRGYLTTAQKCSDDECYRRWFRLGIGFRGAAYRERILPRLFCRDRAAELDRLAQSYAVRAPYLPSPAETLSIDELELKCVAPKGCHMYGGDEDKNWLCDDWETRRNTPLSKPSASPCPEGLPTEAGATPRDKECSRPRQPVFSCPEGRKCETLDSRWVEVRTGLTATQSGSTSEPEKEEEFTDCDGKKVRLVVPPKGEVEDGITLRVKCANGHVVQFISRAYWLAEGGREEGVYKLTDPENPRQLVCFDLTISDKDRKWRTDSRGKPNPYYETSKSYATTCDSMTIFDAPSVKLPEGGKYRLRRVLAKSFAVCDGKVVSVVDWARQHDAREPEPFYQVDPPREPTPEEIEEFRGRSCAEDFSPWP